MPNLDHLPICPYYRADNYKSITCEDTYRILRDERQKKAWTGMYCDSWDWMRCPYAVGMTEAYERLEKGDKDAVENHENEALKNELKKISIKLGIAEKRNRRQQKKIDELRGINQSLTTENLNLNKQKNDFYRKWRDAASHNQAFEEKVFDQVQKISRMYEQRIAYLIENFVPDKRFRESDVSEWAEDKAFALVYERDEEEDDIPLERCWQVKYGEETETEDGQKDTELQTNEAEVRKPESAD